MSPRFRWASLVGLSSLSAAPVLAQNRCDCTTIVESCRAEVAIEASWLEVRSDHAQCSRVDYFVDGLPFVALVVDGVQRQDRIARADSPEILVQSCQVCREVAAPSQPIAPAPRQAAQSTPADAELQALIEVAPQYPETARARGVEGYVDLSFTVNAFGAVESPTVTAAEPPGVFDAAALAAISRWRYPPSAAETERSATRRMSFSLTGSGDQARRAGSAPEPSGPRNQCIREQNVYNFGERVEVGLMSTCADALLLYSCAAGAGQYLGRWVCTSSEQAQALLVAPDDPRIGMAVEVEMPVGVRSFRLGADYVVARAPNTQYWWAACGRNDASCRDNARQWVRSLDRQPADLDPQTRAPLAIARSY